jgi:Tfp pilus assembly protein PilF
MPRADAEIPALAAANKALALDDSLAEAHASIAYIRMQRFEWSAAEAEFRRAIALRNSYAPAHRWYASWLAKQGRSSDAYSEMKTAFEQDPLSVGSSSSLALILFLQRKPDEALAQVRAALQMDASYARGRMLLAQIYAFQRRFPDALVEAERSARELPADLEIQGNLGYIRAVAGRRADAIRLRDALARRAASNEDAAAGGVAIIYVGLGDADRAFEWLARARDLRDPVIAYLKVDPSFDRLRSDPRYARLLSSVGLTQ